MKFAFVFPGQGSQSVGMMDVWSGHPAAMQVIAEASAALGEDLGALMAQGPAEQLSLTTNTQPAMLTAGSRALTPTPCCDKGELPLPLRWRSDAH